MNNTITYLKAFAILLMVFGHVWCPLPCFNQFIYMFHMPLFFFVSGYCFKRKSLEEPGTYLLKKVKGIYWPYVKWSLVFLLLHNVFFHLNLYSSEYGWNGNVSHLYDWHEYLNNALLVVFTMRGHEQLLGGYWFLNAFFFGSIITFISLKLLKKAEICIVVNMIICFLLNRYHDYMPLYYLGTQQFFASTLILAGFCFAERKVPVFPRWAAMLSLVLAFEGSFYWYFELGMFPYTLGRTLPYYVTAILACWSFYSIFQDIRGENIVTRFLTFVGNNTLTILTWHFLFFKVTSAVIIWIYNLPAEQLAEFQVIKDYSYNGWWICYALVSIILSCALAYCNKFIKNSWLKL